MNYAVDEKCCVGVALSLIRALFKYWKLECCNLGITLLLGLHES